MILNYTIQELSSVTKKLLENINCKTILLYGDMGVGKTTLIKELAKTLGSKDEITSPTYSIVNEYELENDKIYHFDLYRLNDIDEAYNFGIEDYLDSKHWVIIEWPEIIEPLILEPFNKIYLSLNEDNSRNMTIDNGIFSEKE